MHTSMRDIVFLRDPLIFDAVDSRPETGQNRSSTGIRILPQSTSIKCFTSQLRNGFGFRVPFSGHLSADHFPNHCPAPQTHHNPLQCRMLRADYETDSTHAGRASARQHGCHGRLRFERYRNRENGGLKPALRDWCATCYAPITKRIRAVRLRRFSSAGVRAGGLRIRRSVRPCRHRRRCRRRIGAGLP